MSVLQDEVEKAYTHYREISAVREDVLKDSRELIRACSKAVVDVHNGKGADIDGITLLRDKLLEGMARFPRLGNNGEQALQEYCELLIFDTIVREGRFPTADECGCGPGPYLLGLADSVGEMRRRCLSLRMGGDAGSAKMMLERMWEVNDALAAVHIPSALLGVRKKRDMVRSLVDRTQSDILD